MLQFINYLIGGLSLGCIYALIAVGYTMVYGIVKLINFAHGEFYMFGAFASYFILALIFGGEANGRDLSSMALIVAMIGAGFATGALAVVVERAVYRPLRKSGRIVALLAALGVSLLLQNAGQQSIRPNFRPFPHTFTSQRYPRTEIPPESLCAGNKAESDISIVYLRDANGGSTTLVENLAQSGNVIDERSCLRLAEIRAMKDAREVHVYAYPAITVTTSQGVILIVLIVISLLLYGLVQHTRFGRAMRAVSHDFDGAALMGIDVNRVIAGTFFVGAFVAGVGGTLGGGMYYNQIDPLMGLMPGLKAFVAAVFGGIGSIPGALLGGVLLGVSEKMVESYVNSMYTDAFTFGLLILVLVVRPSGLLGKAGAEKF